MENNSGADPVVLLTWLLVAVNCFVYLAAKGVATLFNKLRKREVLHPRKGGAIVVAAFTALSAGYMYTHFVNESLYSTLSPFDQGRYVGRVVGTALFPGLLVLGIVAFRGWRSQKKLASDKAQPTAQSDGPASGGSAAEPGALGATKMISATIDDIRFLRNGADGGQVYVRGRGTYEGHGVIDIYAHFQTKEMECEFEATYKAGPIEFHSVSWDFEPSIGLSLWEVVQWSPR